MQKQNDETFINKWWSGLSTPLSFDLEEWIDFTYSTNDRFWRDVVFHRQEQLLPFPKSMYGRSYNFYHDCILRYIKTNNIAFSEIKKNGHVENWSFEKIHHCVNYHIDKWTYHKPEPGELIAIIGPPNISYIIALLTSFRLGLKICYLPTNSPFLGRRQIIKFLTQIKPRFFVCEDSSFRVEGALQFSINENGADEEEHAPHAYSYPEGVEVQIALSLQQKEELELVTLDAQTTYIYALRDALFTFNLLQHPYWAAPLSCPVRMEPCGTIMSLLSGVTKVYVSDDDLIKNPLLIEDARINLLGISHRLQNLWNEHSGIPHRHLKSIFKSPLDTPYLSWKPFIQLHKLEKMPSFDTVIDNSLGGATLFSRPSLEPFNVFVWPTLGNSWHLSQYNDEGQKSLTGYGVFEIKHQSIKGNYTATQSEKKLMLTGMLEPSREGVIFPLLQIEEIVSTLPFVEGCCVHHLLQAGCMFSRLFVLLVFVSPLKDQISSSDVNTWRGEIQHLISEELGSGYLPDKIEFYPLFPKRNILGVDRTWCANQYDAGWLVEKKNLPQYRLIGAIKKLAQEYTKASNH